MATTPRCSVLICTYNRAALLRLTLESLCAQSAGAAGFETVVVDDGSTDGTAAIVEGFAGRLRLRYAYQRNAGLASARNHALFLASGEIVVFQDDDDIAAPDLVAEHIRAHRAHPGENVAVLGRTTLSPSLAKDPLMHFVTEVGQFLFSYPALQEGQQLDFSYFWGGRSSCKRRLLLEHGVFNPVFRFGCEDIELAFRLGRAGLRVIYHPRAVTTTVRAFSFDEFCRRLVRQGRSNWVFSRLHRDPEVQRWTEVESAVEQWSLIEPVYPALLRSGRKLDEAVRHRQAVGMPAEREVRLLHQSYWAAFRASKIKGIVERSRERDESMMPIHAQLLASALERQRSDLGLRPVEHGSLTSSHEKLDAFLESAPTIPRNGALA